ncbi:MAG: RNA methyltransferase [Planctomycetota bacterium]
MHKPNDPLDLFDACAERVLRERWHLAALEGVAPFLQACSAGLEFEALIYDPTLLRSSRAQKLVRHKRAAGVPTRRVSPEDFRRLSRAARASGVAAVVRQRWRTLARVRVDRPWICLERIRSAGNLGTILRTLEAVDGGLILLGPAVDPFALDAVRASMGALFHLDLVRTTLEELRAWARRTDTELVGTWPEGAARYDAPYARRSVLLIGEERRGLSPAAREACARSVSIPIVGRGDSLNVGVACGVLVYEVLRQRQR